jgi:hypothetical protein
VASKGGAHNEDGELRVSQFRRHPQDLRLAASLCLVRVIT